ncbi:DUF937 domain-containing protein [Rhizobium sp. KVB221]|uniref:DUF937 domain-containing protein n=1 Tax=Rhizobium setariae TaxID=2801340 RepID=A0A936YJ46_9HYPH|nr:DUF937 domain-containing protein [Rhizobium setariae]MBL0370548.1 DUF937 domain-containing protein [Rhizobium setariae]
MLPLFDLMLKAQNGHAVEAMSKQFGLAQEQMKDAMAALMPAFSTGLKRTATNPYDFTSLMSSAMSGNYTQYFEDMAKAFTPKGITDGNTILAQIFGSKDVSRAVAAQAAQMSGIGQDIYKQMLPIVANTMVGGFFKQMAEQFQATGEAFTSGNGANLFDQWMRATGLADKPKRESNPMFDNPFTQSFQAMFTPQAGKDSSTSANPLANNPFLQMFQAMMTQAQGNSDSPKPADAAPQAGGIADLVNQMFDSGIEVQKSYQKSMDSIFDTYLSNLKPNTPK